MSKWTRDQIIRAIVSLESAGRPLHLGRNGAVGQGLYQAGSRVFGSWSNALMAAGIAPQHATSKERWPPSKILAAIRSLSRRRHPLRTGELQERYSSLVQAARRCFGTWSRAVVAAGIDPSKLRRVAPWTKERIIEAILTRALKNEPLGSRTVRPRSLAEAGAKVFGTWASALTTAGLDAKSFGQRARTGPSSEQQEQSCRHVQSVIEPGPMVAPRPGRRWSAQSVLDAIEVRLRGHQLMNAKAVYRDDRPLYRAATRRHGNWSNALSAAGLNPDHFRKRGACNRVRHDPWDCDGFTPAISPTPPTET